MHLWGFQKYGPLDLGASCRYGDTNKAPKVLTKVPVEHRARQRQALPRRYPQRALCQAVGAFVTEMGMGPMRQKTK